MTWDEIYDRADGAACGDSSLNAKDEARHQVRCLMMDLGAADLDNAECPEDVVESYCDAMNIQFDECGNITGLKLPQWVEDIVHDRVNLNNRTQDVLEHADEMCFFVTESDAKVIARRFLSEYDCNRDENSMLEEQIRNYFKGGLNNNDNFTEGIKEGHL